MCGGILAPCSGSSTSKGLSPRVRGHRISSASSPSKVRSIPACAGASPGRRPPTRPFWVYPRVCGGIGNSVFDVAFGHGLSPRVRGHLTNRRKPRGLEGSIPACAGASNHRQNGKAPQRVYPRVCGGILTGSRSGRNSWGLSPRVRGHQRTCRAARNRRGSIPACAGASSSCVSDSRSSWVYPRVCGGILDPHRAPYPSSGLSPRVRGHRGRG